MNSYKKIGIFGVEDYYNLDTQFNHFQTHFMKTMYQENNSKYLLIFGRSSILSGMEKVTSRAENPSARLSIMSYLSLSSLLSSSKIIGLFMVAYFFLAFEPRVSLKINECSYICPGEINE